MTASNANKTAPTNISELAAEHHLADKTLIIFDWDGTLMDSIGLIGSRKAMRLARYMHRLND